jgi:hypothetical protein
VLFETLTLVVKDRGKALSVASKAHGVETASIILVEVELGVDEGFSRTQLGQEKYCNVFVVEVAGKVNRNSVVFVLLIEQLEEVVLIQDLATVSQLFDYVGE